MNIVKRWTTGIFVVVATILGVLAGPASTSAVAGTGDSTRPVMRVPFPCHQVWRGATFSNHGPQLAMDINLYSGGDTDLGKPVLASAGGRVTYAGYKGGTAADPSYGYTVDILHSGGWTTRYAHLQRIDVAVNQSVTHTTRIGLVGKSGYQSSAHLHYEQRYDAAARPIRFGYSSWATYYDSDQRLERTNC